MLDDAANIRTRTKVVDGKGYVLAYNYTNKSTPVTFTWQKLSAGREVTIRAKLPGGWLISVGDGAGRSVVFYPDPQHEWDGTTL